MFKVLGLVVSVAFYSLFSNASFAEIDVSTTSAAQPSESPEPMDVVTDGSFKYSVPIDIPAFRGLVPNIGITYNSGLRSVGRPENILGVGWSLQGFSSIERTLPGGGTPSYVATRDIYRLDGQELVACKDTGATNPYPWNYASTHETSRPSASCSAGGRLSTIRESYRRIDIKPTQHNGQWINHFIVYNKDGTQYKYESLGIIAGDTVDPNTDDFNFLFKRKWLLTEIRDTQTNANVVTISYAFSSVSKGRAHRPAHIDYGNGYRVQFYYGYFANPLATYSLGNDSGTSFGIQNYRLNAIAVTNNGSKIRAYKLSYANSDYTQRYLLTKVQQYGSNYSLSGSNITGGTTLPAHQFTYNSDNLSFTATDYAAARFHTSNVISDIDGDGRAEALFFDYTYSGSGSLSLPSKHYGFSKTGALIDKNSGPVVGYLPDTSFTVAGSSGTSISPLGVISEYTRGIDGIYTTREKYVLTHKKTVSNSAITSGTNFLKLTSLDDGVETGNRSIANDSGAQGCWSGGARFAPLVGNFDKDPGKEVVYQETVYDIHNGDFVEKPTWKGDLSQYCETVTQNANMGFEYVVDLDGDGIDEIVTSTAYFKRVNGAFVKILLPNSPFDGLTAASQVSFGDVNGDGAADVIIHKRSGPKTLKVALSTGSGFLDPVEWITSSYSGINPKPNQINRSMVADINGDGLSDLILHRGFDNVSTSNAAVEKSSLHAYVFISTGSGFKRYRKRCPSPTLRLSL